LANFDPDEGEASAKEEEAEISTIESMEFS